MSRQTKDGPLLDKIREAIGRVEDPEYPGLSIVDLGILESIRVTPGGVTVGLVPTFSGCPALSIIAEDVRNEVGRVGTVGTVDGAEGVEVVWLRSPPWSTRRLSARARSVLADSYTVGVQIGSQTPLCPRCGGTTALQSTFGPSRCRSIHTCSHCSEPVEVLRGCDGHL